MIERKRDAEREMRDARHRERVSAREQSERQSAREREEFELVVHTVYAPSPFILIQPISPKVGSRSGLNLKHRTVYFSIQGVLSSKPYSKDVWNPTTHF